MNLEATRPMAHLNHDGSWHTPLCDAQARAAELERTRAAAPRRLLSLLACAALCGPFAYLALLLAGCPLLAACALFALLGGGLAWHCALCDAYRLSARAEDIFPYAR